MNECSDRQAQPAGKDEETAAVVRHVANLKGPDEDPATAPENGSLHEEVAQGFGAGRRPQRASAADAFVLMTTRGSLDTTRLGHELAGLAADGTLKLGRLTESLTLAVQGGARHAVAAVLATTLPALLPAPGTPVRTGLAALLNLAADCAEQAESTAPVEGIAELAAREGFSLYLKAARRLHANTRMVEPFGGGTGFRFKIRNMRIDGRGGVVRVRSGGSYEVRFEVLHDCSECGNAINQVIVGLAGQERAQASVWNGKRRSGGDVKVVNPGSRVQVLAEDNPGPAEWVGVSCEIAVPDEPGTYEVRARYAQAYQGRLMTAEGRTFPQREYEDVLGWWKVDRPDGPGPQSTIGTVIVE
ncbi:hypothetical protein [Streptomyces sp. NPDC057301]|uniref:hypothetical protein n=1 Tax=Streptomyces sp. NPDC057301 TaxID=3346093 RepID=UPI003645A177